MWKVIYIAPSVKIAEKIQDRLVEEGFLVKVKASQHGKQYEILVAESELEGVEEVLSRILQ